MALTDIQVRNATPRERDFKLGDSGGLYVLVRPNGSKLWRMKYRVDGREQKLSFGPYPAISLKEARLRRDEARVEIGRGGDPAKRQRKERIEAEISAGNSFAEVATEYIEKCAKEGYAEATLKKSRWFLDLLSPSIGSSPVAEVSPHELLSARSGASSGRAIARAHVVPARSPAASSAMRWRRCAPSMIRPSRSEAPSWLRS